MTDTPNTVTPAAADVITRTAAQDIAAVRDALFNVEKKVRGGNSDTVAEKLVDGLVDLTHRVASSLETVTATLARVIDQPPVSASAKDDASADGDAGSTPGGRLDPNIDEYGRPILDKKGRKIAYVGKTNTRWL